MTETQTETQAERLPPVPGETEHGGYVVRAVVQGQRDPSWQLPHWYVAAEHPRRGWITWTVVDQHGLLLFCMPDTHSVDGREGDQGAALEDMARRAGIAAGTIRFQAFDRETGQRWAVSDWDQADRPKLTAYVTRTTSRGRSLVTLTFDNGTQKHYPRS